MKLLKFKQRNKSINAHKLSYDGYPQECRDVIYLCFDSLNLESKTVENISAKLNISPDIIDKLLNDHKYDPPYSLLLYISESLNIFLHDIITPEKETIDFVNHFTHRHCAKEEPSQYFNELVAPTPSSLNPVSTTHDNINKSDDKDEHDHIKDNKRPSKTSISYGPDNLDDFPF